MKKKVNLLDLIPERNQNVLYDRNKDGNIEICIRHTDFYGRLVSLLFHKPKKSYIELDRLGSCIWEQADGTRSIFEIGKILRENYGEEAEPLYERLCQYVCMLRQNGLILFRSTM